MQDGEVIVIPRKVVVIPDELSIDAVAKSCADAGFGKVLPGYDDNQPVVVVVDGIRGVMPKWMAEVFGHKGR